MEKTEVVNKNDVFFVKAKEYLEKNGIISGKFSESDIEMFLTYCKELKLNPFMNEVYAFITTGPNGKQQLKTVISYHVYLQWAEESNLLDGWEYEFAGEGDELKCTVTIYRKDWNRPFKHTVYLSDCGIIVKSDGTTYSRFRKGMERHMILKTAVSQAMRLCLPKHMRSLPYTREEMLFYNDEVPINGNNNQNNQLKSNDKQSIIIKSSTEKCNDNPKSNNNPNTNDTQNQKDNLWIDEETGDVYPFSKHPEVIKSCYHIIFNTENSKQFGDKLAQTNKDLYDNILKCLRKKGNKITFIGDLEIYNDHDFLLNEYNKLIGNNNNNNENENESEGDKNNQ
jgi:hypothetical protein